MIFTPKNAGKWVASKDGRVIAAAGKLQSLMKKVEQRSDKEVIRYDLVHVSTVLCRHLWSSRTLKAKARSGRCTVRTFR